MGWWWPARSGAAQDPHGRGHRRGPPAAAARPDRALPMSPHTGPQPADTRYRVVVTQISDHGVEVTFDHTAQAYIAAVADLSPTGTRITATVDHDGDLTLRQRLVVYIADAIHRP